MSHHYYEDSDPVLVGGCRLFGCEEMVWSNQAVHISHINDLLLDETVERLVAVAVGTYAGAYVGGTDRRPIMRREFLNVLRKKLNLEAV